MGNRSLCAIAIGLIVVMVAGVSVFAYLFRFEPLFPSEGHGIYYVWDRWKHRVGISSLPESKIIYPKESQDKPATPADAMKAQRDSRVHLSRVETLRQAGFSEKEILEHIFEEREKLKTSGATDKELYDYFFSSDQPKIRSIRE